MSDDDISYVFLDVSKQSDEDERRDNCAKTTEVRNNLEGTNFGDATEQGFAMTLDDHWQNLLFYE